MDRGYVTFFVAFCLLLLLTIGCAYEDEDNEGFAPVYEDDSMEHNCEEPPPPFNGELICGKHKKKKDRYVCKARCDEGYEFPNGKRKWRNICNLNNGKWTPEYTFPDCEPICKPRCENGAECVEGNHCVCTPEYRGDRCQYALGLCDPERDLVPAEWSCNHTSEQTLCVMNCPQGTRYESHPEDIYHCSLDGTWSPSFAPKCIPINVIEPPFTRRMYPVLSGQLVTSSLPNSDVCAVWGTSHYRTFDGGIYSFQGPCSYLLSKDCEQNTFAIHIQNAAACETVSHCPISLVIYIGSEQYLLLNGPDGGPIVQNGGQEHAIPTSVNGLLFQMLSDYVTVSSSLGFRLKWNRKNTILLKASRQLWNKTCGLCGKFDGSVLNDFETSDGSITDSVEVFVNSWTMEDFREKCEQKAVVKDSCSETKEKVLEAEKLCSAIFENRFSSCHQLVDPKTYFEVCKMDHCSCQSGSCYCGTLSEYFRECTRLGGKIEGGWRSSELCPLSCPEGMIYQDCGTSCPKTCKNTIYDCEDNHCIDGCHCPDGMVLHHGRCVQKSDCPCMHSGKEHQTGDRILMDCNACECNGGKWECTKEKCEARCISAGDPHYTTFDGFNYEFLGSCPYYLVYSDNFTVVQESGPCPASSEPATEGMFCTNSIKISYLKETLFLQPGIIVNFNEQTASLPIIGDGIKASMATALFLKVNLGNGASILWDGENRIYIDVPPTLIGQTMGLCGTFNKNQNDDFLTPDKDIEADASAFASRWKASDACHKRSRRRSQRNPCESQPQKFQDAELLCSALTRSVFEACHGEVDPFNYYKSCVSDLCVCTQALENCLCPILADYSLACSKKGIVINWVDELAVCKPECSGGQMYQECSNPCTSSCAAISSTELCKTQCVQGCACVEGMTLSNEGICVTVDQCPCIFEGKEYPPASVCVQGANVCTCQGAKWQCRPGTLPELVSLNSNLMIDDDPSHQCLPGNNEEFTQCQEKCPRTCQNMHLETRCKTDECKPGCRCKEGFIYDSEKNRCVTEKECGCTHGRQRYREGESIKQSCNLCTCLEGTWQCSERVCPGVCSIWGESHFKTFDGKIFDFHGECEYILSKGKMKGASYTLTVQNVPCGTSGVTCSKSFTLDLGPVKANRGDISEITAESEKLTLSRNDPLPKTSYNSRFVVIESGLFVIVYSDIGVSLQWDKGTLIYLTVDPKWRKRVRGLCGNFNDDQADDFLTPSGGIPEASASVFADCWKVHEFCPRPLMIEDVCEIHPQRKIWAQQKCGILKSEKFVACHSEVAMEPFYERCVFDSCACDMGGDCECLCTAIAAYAHECSMRGIPIKWRSQELCPIQCEECATYSSCIPSCPKKTCENELVYGKITEACAADFCVEGCDPKPCPEGQIYNNSREYNCIPLAECVVPCMELNGRLYNEGDRITDMQVVDACQSCHCLRGEVSCSGPPCANIEQAKACMETGWTPWLNTPAFIGGDYELLTDPRLRATLENYCGIANMTDIQCRVAESKMPYKETGQRVSCRLPKGFSCNDKQQKNTVCLDYEIRVYCDCGPIPTEYVTPPVTTALTLPPVCEQTGWSSWLNEYRPDKAGDFETLDKLRIKNYFCDIGQIENVECRTVKGWEYVSDEDENVICNKKVGLVCNGPKCKDYEIRFYCNCETETPVPTVPSCVTGWTEFFNTDHPDTSDTGDDESLDRIRMKHNFCAGGTIENIDCKAMMGDRQVDYSELDSFGLKCSKNVGFVCNKYVRTEKCEDFMVRFYCACEPVSEIIPTTTTTLVPITPVPVECGWTPWLNIDNPDTGDGDIEDLKKIQALYKTCGGKDLVDIECRMSRTLHKYSDSLQSNLLCNTQQGFQCLNNDQTGSCYDYEVRLLCMYTWCYPTTTTPLPTTTPVPTTLNPCPDGQVYDICAYHCDQLCMSFDFQVAEECKNAVDACIPGCRPISGCESPKMWRDYQTCVTKQECTCIMEDENGDKRNVAPGQMIEKTCEECQCLDNAFVCRIIPHCGETEPPGKSRILLPNIVQEDCWTKWINLDKPETSGGDFETPILFRKEYELCDNPVKIECRTAESRQKALDVGQYTTCDVKEGLICWNNENMPEGCYDYEIRLFCPCPTSPPTTTTTITPIPTLKPGPCEYGWTGWYNTHVPDNRGDYETVQSSRIYHTFCSSDMISAMECREIGKASGQLQRGVICDLDIGLKCNPELLEGEEKCGDYEIRFFCDCPTLPPITKLEVTTPLPETTQPPIEKACAYWSDWINENHPDSRKSATKKGSIKGARVIKGDTEKVMPLKLQREYHFCMDGDISNIECREASSDVDYTETGDSKLICSLIGGFRCRGKDQSNKICKDYKIRYFCACVETTPTLVITKPTTPEIYVKPCSRYYKVIDGPSPLPDANLKASTSKDASSGPQSARLSSTFNQKKSAGAWIAGTVNNLQFIEIDLGRIQPVYGVVTKGRSGHDEWVKSYRVLYSRDGMAYSFVRDYGGQNGEKIFTGNSDSESEVTHIFENPFEARYIRIQPLTFFKEIAMRVDVLGCAEGLDFLEVTTTIVPPCVDEMGLNTGYIRDYQIKTSSNRNQHSDGRYVRLNTQQTEENSGGWVAQEADDNQYVQIDFMDLRNLTGIKTQGRDRGSQWVTAFTVSYSKDNKAWNYVSDQNGLKIFPGNYDSSSIVTNYFPQPIRTRFLRIHPIRWENWISMRLEVLGCFESYEEVKDIIATTPKHVIVQEHCAEPMGFENHQLPDARIYVSSSLGPNTGASRIRLNTHKEGEKTGGWKPANDDYQPVVVIDFGEERNLTGILTQGFEDDDLWVMTYNVLYSLDNKTWEYVVDMETNSVSFPGNSDRNSISLRLFSQMVTARFLKVVILDWHTLPALRMEIWGCFIPYTVYTVAPATFEPTEMCIENGPWMSISDPANSLIGDEEPIDKIIALSGVCGNPIDIECRTVITRKDYTQVGQVMTCDLVQGLVCKNQMQNSMQCYNYEVRIKCWTCETTTVTTPRPLVLCPEVPDIYRSNCPPSCPHDYACDGTSCVLSTECPCFRDGKKFEPSNIAVTQDCKRCECIIGGFSTCEQIHCPACLPGQKPDLDSSCQCHCIGCADGTVMCPSSGECVKEEQWCDGVVDCPDDETGCPTTVTLPVTTTEVITEVPLICSTEFLYTDSCELVANMFETFDGMAYQYDICDHVLMKEANSELYSISIHKTCSSESSNSCNRYLVIEVDNVIIKLGPRIEDITVQNNYVPLDNLWLVSHRFKDFELKKRGNTIVFSSKKYNFDVTWNTIEDVKITVSKCLVHKVVGLCGLYNNMINDDLTMANGVMAKGNEEFGDSWSIGSLERCTPPKCPAEVMKVAIETCKTLKQEPFNSSCAEFIQIERRVEACVTHMCDCLQWTMGANVLPSSDIFYDFFDVGGCKCQAYESFVEACESVKQGFVREWRIDHGCTPECPPGLEWQDCGPGCELTCDNYHQREDICNSVCVPGCYCPTGLLKHHNRCVKPKMCQDCVCRGHGDPNYITFDGEYYAFQGICTYILAQHQTSDNQLMNFRILSHNVECPEEPHTSCTEGLTVNWYGHVIEKFKNKPVYLDEVAVSAEDSPLEHEGISITYVPNKSTIIHIKEINLAIRYFDQMYGFNIELPAFYYLNKTEGLCGICNFIQSDDLYHRDGYVTDDIEDFAYSWLEESESRKNCELPREEVPEPPPGICNFTVSPCEVFLDPTLYSQSCQNDVSYSQKPEASMCRSKFQYAQQCCERGISLVEWLHLSGCESICPEGMVYECASACPKTCDNYKEYHEDDCDLMSLYTCVCPEGEVLNLGKCVKTEQCEMCDDQGHIVGDNWQVGPCKTCECMPDLLTSCTVMTCPEPPVCNTKETLQKLNRPNNTCCDTYQCLPLAEKICPEPPLEECPPGQAYVKDYVDGCPTLRCECIPDLCPMPIRPLLDDGENLTVITIDCCHEFKTFCDLDACEQPPKCSPGFKLATQKGKCCNKYKCVPRKDVCVYQHKHDVINGTIQVDLAIEDYFEEEYEPGTFWQDGLCRKCSCEEQDGQFSFRCRIEICPDPADFPDTEKYYREEIRIPGACCPKYHRIACLVEGVRYEINQEWPSPDGNPCKSYKCIADNKGEAIQLEKTTLCDTNCSEHAVYVESSPNSGKCCGKCKMIACEENGNMYHDGESWISTSKPCFTAECQVSENGTRITYKGESCPIMPDNCAPENVKTDAKGCCTYCKAPTETCSSVEVPVYESRGFFNYVDEQRGFCSNGEVIRNLTKCGGMCSTSSHYSDLIGDFQSVCNCCLPKESQKRIVSLECEDGSKVEKLYMQPITCQCLSCSGSSRSLEALNKVEPYKK